MMNQIRAKYYIISIDDNQYISVYYDGKVRLVKYLDQAVKFATPYLALEQWDRWRQANHFNYELAPKLMAARVEEVEVLRKIIPVIEYPAANAKPPTVINPEQLRKLQYYGDPFHKTDND